MMIQKKYLLILLVLLFSTIHYSQPNSPTNLVANLGNQSSSITVELAWKFIESSNPVKFNVYKKTGAISDVGDFVIISSGLNKTNVYFDSNVQRDKIYSYYVTSVENNIESKPSNIIEKEVYSPVILDDKIRGRILNESTKDAISGATVAFIPYDNSGQLVSVITDNKGFFSSNLEAGSYYIYLSAPGYISEYYDNRPTKQLANAVTFIENDSVLKPTSKKKMAVLLVMHLKPISY